MADEADTAALERHTILVHARRQAEQASLIAAGALGEHNAELATLAASQASALLSFAASVERLDHHEAEAPL